MSFSSFPVGWLVWYVSIYIEANFVLILILKPILFYLLIILFDGSGDINFSYCFVFTFVFRLFFLLLRLLRCFTDALHDGCKHLRSSHCLQRARHFSYNFYFSFVVFPPLQLNQACRICLSVTLPPLIAGGMIGWKKNPLYLADKYF